MKTRTHFIATILIGATMAGTTLTYAQGTKNSKESAPQDRRIQYLESLSKAKQDVAAISTGVDALLKTVKDAKASEDKAKMKTALDATQKHLVEMKVHSESCMKHMESMEMDMKNNMP